MALAQHIVSQPPRCRHLRCVDIGAHSSHSNQVDGHASWWGYAEADPALVGVVVAAVAAFAVIYVGQRLLSGRRRVPGQRAAGRQGPR